MKNLDQIRASHALKASTSGENYGGDQGGEVVKKIPPIIMNNGLLATCAFASSKMRDQEENYQNQLEKSNQGRGNPPQESERLEGWGVTFNHIAKHLSHCEIGRLPEDCDNLEAMVEHLTRPEATSQELKLATLETMAWLNFARRFITKGSGSGNEDSEE